MTKRTRIENTGSAFAPSETEWVQVGLGNATAWDLNIRIGPDGLPIPPISEWLMSDDEMDPPSLSS